MIRTTLTNQETESQTIENLIRKAKAMTNESTTEKVLLELAKIKQQYMIRGMVEQTNKINTMQQVLNFGVLI